MKRYCREDYVVWTVAEQPVRGPVTRHTSAVGAMRRMPWWGGGAPEWWAAGTPATMRGCVDQWVGRADRREVWFHGPPMGTSGQYVPWAARCWRGGPRRPQEAGVVVRRCDGRVLGWRDMRALLQAAGLPVPWADYAAFRRRVATVRARTRRVAMSTRAAALAVAREAREAREAKRRQGQDVLGGAR